MDATEKLIKELQKQVKSSAMRDYRKDQQKRHDLYRGKFRQYILAMLKEACPATWQDFRPVWINAYRKVIDRRAGGLFRKPPKRVLIDQTGASVPDSEALYGKVFGVDRGLSYLNGQMDKAARYLEIHKTILLSVVWRHNRIEIDVVPPMLFHVEQGYPDPTCLEDAEAVILYQTGRQETDSQADECQALIWQAMDPENGTDPRFLVVNDETGKVLEQGDNPYFDTVDGNHWAQIFPCVLMQAEDPDAELYIPGGEDLTEAALHVGFTLTDNEFIERYQGFGQPKFTGVDKTQVADMVLSPSVALALSEGESFAFESPPQLGTNRLDSLLAFLRMLATSYDLPADVFDESKKPESGVARRIGSTGLIVYRGDLAERLAMYEQRLFRVVRSVWNAHNSQDKRIPWNWSYSCQAAEQDLPFDPIEADQRMSGRLAIGLDSVVEILAKERGVTEEQARVTLAQNRADNAASLIGVPRVGSAVPASTPAASSDAFAVDVTSNAAGKEGPVKRGLVAALRERLAAKDAAGNGQGGG